MTPIRRLKRKLFIGSSVEGLRIAKALRLNFEHETQFDAYVWDAVQFRLSSATLASLQDFLHDFFYAVFVLTPDDAAQIREKKVAVPRDNVLFELGLFLGRAGPSCTFAVKPRGVEIHLPTDLAGITLAEYKQPSNDQEYGNAMVSAAEKIRQAIVDHERLLRDTAYQRMENWKAETRQALRTCRSDVEKVSVVCGRLQHVLGDKATATGQTVEGVLQDLLLDVESLMDVLDPAQLADYQSGALEEVWVQAAEPLEVLEHNVRIRERVLANLGQGVKYTYIVPSKSAKNRIKRALFNGETQGQAGLLAKVRIVVAPEGVFHTPYTVQKYDHKRKKVLQSLLRPGRKDVLHELDDENADRIERKLRKLIACASRSDEDQVTFVVAKCPICDNKIRG